MSASSCVQLVLRSHPTLFPDHWNLSDWCSSSDKQRELLTKKVWGTFVSFFHFYSRKLLRCCLFFSLDRNVFQSLRTFVRDPLIKSAFREPLLALSIPLIENGDKEYVKFTCCTIGSCANNSLQTLQILP